MHSTLDKSKLKISRLGIDFGLSRHRPINKEYPCDQEQPLHFMFNIKPESVINFMLNNIQRFGRNLVQYPVIELLQRVVQLITSNKESDAINFECSNQIHTHFIIEKRIR